MSRSLRFLSQRNRGHTSDHPIEAIEDSLRRHGVAGVDNDASLLRLGGKVLARSGLARRIGVIDRTTYLVPIMGPCFYRFVPFVWFSETIPFAHDCWEPDFPRWERFLRKAGIRRAFFTARQSAEAMSERVPGLHAEWLPEGITPIIKDGNRPLGERSIDVLELGRRSDRFHQAVTAHCAAQGYRHRFQKAPGELVFPDQAAFWRGMTDTRLMVCFPSSMTNPERSGTVETLTLRYLEGIACGSVLLGHAPTELLDLFGYNPVVQVDFADPQGQLDRLLGSIDTLAPLVARNRARLNEVGTWDVRIADLLARLRRDGIVPS